MRVRYSSRSDIGQRREVNQDSHGERQGHKGTLLVVCDGMGGHAAGEVASRLAVEVIIAACAPDSAGAADLQQAFSSANERVYTDGRGSMGTTGVAALLRENALTVANVGDSRAYLVREGRIQQISRDHSFVSDQVAAGLMTPEQARASNIRNIITRALGHQPAVEVDLFSRGLRAGDTIVLSSDGMHGLIEDAEIAEITSMLPPDQAAQRLIETANARGGNDNITVVIAQVDELDPDSPELPLEGELAPDDEEAPARPQAGAPAPPLEPPLSRRGLLLAALTLLALLSMGSYILLNSRFSAGPAATATSLPASPTPALAIVTTTASPAPASPTRPAASPTAARPTPTRTLAPTAPATATGTGGTQATPAPTP